MEEENYNAEEAVREITENASNPNFSFPSGNLNNIPHKLPSGQNHNPLQKKSINEKPSDLPNKTGLKNKNSNAEALKNKIQRNRPNSSNNFGASKSNASNKVASAAISATTGVPKPIAEMAVNNRNKNGMVPGMPGKFSGNGFLDKLFGNKEKKIKEESEVGGGVQFKVPEIVKKGLLYAAPILAIVIVFIVLMASASQIMIKSVGLGNADETSASDAEEKINSNIDSESDTLNEEVNDNDLSYNYTTSAIIERKIYAKSKTYVRKNQEADLTELKDFYGDSLNYNSSSNMDTVIKFYFKLKDIYTRYQMKNVKLDLSLLMASLMVESEDINFVFKSNTAGEQYDRKSISSPAMCELDPEWDWSGYVPSKTDSSHDIEILAQHMVKDNGNGSYVLDLEGYKEYLGEFVNVKYYGGSFSSTSEYVCQTQSESTFAKYSLTDDQLLQIASLCIAEQGSPKGAAAEASLMANRFELKGSKYGIGAEGLMNYIRNSGWWSKAASHMDERKASAEVVAAVKSVLVDGFRTLPGYIDEHDCISCGKYFDITKISISGNIITDHSGLLNKANYIKNQTIIYNRYGGTYTFYSFPTETSDPFGYTSESNRTKIGENVYEFGATSLTVCEKVDEQISSVCKGSGTNKINDGSEKWTDSQGHTYSLFKQNGDIYKNVKYPGRGSSATLGHNGCGPTSIAIIESGFGGTITPKTLVSDGKNYSGYLAIKGYFEKHGYNVSYKYSLKDSEIINYLKNGYKIVVLSKRGYMGNYSLGSYSHWYTLLDTDGSKVYVGDPVKVGGGWFSLSQLTKRSNYIIVKKDYNSEACSTPKTESAIGKTVNVGGRTYPIYSQYDDAFGYDKYSYGMYTLKEAGCGPISLAAALSGITGTSITPQTVVSEAKSYFKNTSSYVGTYGSNYPGIFGNSFLSSKFNVLSTDLGTTRDWNKIQSYLDKGYDIIGSVSWGSGGHIIAILSISEQEKSKGYNFYVYDSTDSKYHGSGYYATINDYYKTVQKNPVKDFKARYAIKNK